MLLNIELISNSSKVSFFKLESFDFCSSGSVDGCVLGSADGGVSGFVDVK